MEFSDKCLVGVADIDSQHRALVDIINRLYRIALRRDAISGLDGLVDDLSNYLALHCAYEERLFFDTGYADAAQHKAQHDAFRAQVASFTSRHGGDLIAALDLLHSLKLWLSEHIMVEDRKACAYLNAHGIF